MTALNENQKRARDFHGSNLLILAGAGSGKTETIAARALKLADLGGSRGLTLITFTKKAASALQARFEEGQSGHDAFIGTFHSLCWRIIRDHGHRLEIDGSWAIMDQADQMRLMKRSCSNLLSEHIDPADCLKLLSFSINSSINLDEALNQPRFREMRGARAAILEITERYKRKSKSNKRLDFDLIISTANHLLSEFPDVKQMVQQRYRTILVDEYQDTNRLQSELLQHLDTGSNITVVGDDAQSIYSFRAARIENILEFERYFRADRLELNINYRCPKPVLDLAEASLRKNSQRLERSIRARNLGDSRPLLMQAEDPNEEAKYVAEKIKNLLNQGVRPADISILFRATRLSLPLQQILDTEGIKYTLPNADDFFSLPHIKFFMDSLRLAIEPEDTVALATLYDLLIGDNLRGLEDLEQSAAHQQTSIWATIEDNLPENHPLRQLSARLIEIQNNDSEHQSVASSLSVIMNFLSEPLERYSGGGSVWDFWLADISLLQTLAQPFTSVYEFLRDISGRNVSRNETTESIQFSTIHGAKGLEWEYVFIIGLVEFWFPMKKAIADQGNDEEERRLFYVACTRTRHELFLSSFKTSLNPYGKAISQQRSRFIDEVLQYIEGG